MRAIIAILVGVLIGTTFLVIFGAVGASLQSPLPEDLVMSDPVYNAARVAATPALSWLLTMFGIMIGSFLAGMIGTSISKTNSVLVTSLIGGLLSLWTLYGFIMVPEIPLWYDIVSLTLYLAFSYFGGEVIRRNRGSSLIS